MLTAEDSAIFSANAPLCTLLRPNSGVIDTPQLSSSLGREALWTLLSPGATLTNSSPPSSTFRSPPAHCRWTKHHGVRRAHSQSY